MKTNNSKTKAKAFLGAAALIIAAILALLFTACPNNAGGSGSGSATPPAPLDVGSFEDAGDFVKIIPPTRGIVGVDPKLHLTRN